MTSDDHGVTAPTAPTAQGRASDAALAREHEMARMRAKLMNPESARSDLAERLQFAHLCAGRTPLSALGKAVGYSKATLSKVLTGKMLPSWVLVRELGMHFDVPPEVVVREWFPLWTAAHIHRSRTDTARARAEVAPATGSAVSTTRTGYTCPTCGSWVVDPALHADWHRSGEPAAPAGPMVRAAGSVRSMPLRGDERR